MSLAAFLAAERDVVRVEIAATRGSTPRETGAHLYVSPSALWGTIGGGQLEYLAIDEARRMMRQGLANKEMTIPLGPEIGQCCGGVVTLSFTLLGEELRARAISQEQQGAAQRPAVYIFGAGHVGRALASGAVPFARSSHRY